LVITILSNGYGEDAVGALLAAELLKAAPSWQVQAYPVVDAGRAYEPLQIPILGPRRVMPGGGLLLHHPRLLVADLRAGFLRMTWRQIGDLRRLKTDLLLVVGDVYALLLASQIRTQRRYQVQPLISAYHSVGGRPPPHRLFMEEFTGLERFLMRRLVRQVYVRDAPTAALLRAKGVPQVTSLGNPMLDALMVTPRPVGLTPPVVALLPGSRGYAAEALAVMLEAMTHWPEASAVVAWAPELDALPSLAGWQRQVLAAGQIRLRCGSTAVLVLRERFADILHGCDLVIGTAGTAHEQAAAIGKPVVAFPVPPYYSRGFLRNQARLLGAALTVAPAEPTALAAALRALWSDPERYERAAREGRERMGEAGGSARIVADILRREGLMPSPVEGCARQR
jgi:uncharacterized protein (TIGR03492 family)